MPIKITSKRNGFRRCGIEHPDQPVIYPDGTFNSEQFKVLKAEPMLIIEEIKEQENVKPINPLGGVNVQTAIEKIATMTLDELKQVAEIEERVTVKKVIDERIQALTPEAEKTN